MKYCQQFQAEYEHILWFFCDQSIQAGILKNGQTAAALELNFSPATKPQDRLRHILGALAQWSGKKLLIIDNANDAADIRQTPLRCPSWHILLTTRADLSSNSRFYTKKINVLSPNIAADLFCKYYPKAAEQSQLLHRLLAAVAYHTLLIEILAKTLALRSRSGYQLQNLCDDLDRHNVLDLPTAAPVEVEYYQHRHEKVRPEAILAKMFQWTDLSEVTLVILRYFAVLPADFIPFAHLVYLFELEEDDRYRFQDELDALCEQGWLEYSEVGYKLHQIIQTVLRKQYPPTCAYYGGLLQLLKQTFKEQNISQSHVYLPYGEQLVEVLEDVNERLRTLCYEFCDAYADFGSLYQALAMAQRHEEVCLFLEDERNLIVAYNRIGNIYLALGQMDDTLKYYQLFSKKTEQLYNKNKNSEDLKNGLAISYSKLGDLYQNLGKYDQALEYFEKRTKLGKELHQSNPQSEGLKNGLAISYEKLGDLYQNLGKYEQALEYFELETNLFEELHQGNPQSEGLKNGLAISYSKLGDLYQNLGKYDQALEYFEKRTKLGKELHQSNPQSEGLKNGLAISYSKLGDLYKNLGKYDQALEYFEKRTKLGKELHQSNPQSEGLKNGLAISYSKLGALYQNLGKYDQALEYFELDVKLTKELHQSNPQSEGLKNGLAISYQKLGNIKMALDDLESAKHHYQNYLDLSLELYQANPQNYNLQFSVANAYSKLGKVYQLEKDLKQVQQYFKWSEQHYVALWEKTQLPVFERNLAYVREQLEGET